MPVGASLGATLKKLRQDRGLTLAQVTTLSGIPRSTVSKIENGQTSPTFDNLTRLSNSLNVDIVQLFSEISGDQASRRGGRISVNKHGSGDVIQINGQILTYLSTNLLDKKFTPIIADVRARSLAEFGSLMYHSGDEFLFVLEGQLEFHTDTYAPILLEAGESVYFDSGMGHAYIAHGDHPCRTLSICTVAKPKDVAANDMEPSDKPVARATRAPKSRRLRQAGEKRRGRAKQ